MQKSLNQLASFIGFWSLQDPAQLWIRIYWND